MDATLINSTTDLVALVPGLRRSGRYFIGPCPFCGGRDRFTVKRTDDGDVWLCRHCAPDKYHDAVAFRMRAEGKSFREVIGTASKGEGENGGMGAGEHAFSRPTQPSAGLVNPPDEDWQIARLVAQKEAADRLNDPGDAKSRSVYGYLRGERGLSPDTIHNTMLGFNPEWRRLADGGFSAPGIHIPCMIAGQLWYVKVRLPRTERESRRFKGKSVPKYLLLGGSRTALFNANRLLEASVAVVVEGEFDALLLGQFLPPGWAAVTMGSAATLPGPTFLHHFSGVERVLLRLDDDDAGRAALAAWQGLFGRAERLPPFPGGAKDVTDFWRGGGDVGRWLFGSG